MNFKEDHNCFVCGQNNPAGLKLIFQAMDSLPGVQAEIVFPSHLQGWENTVHGGLLATVLDEAMIKAASALGYTCVTAEISVKYKKPVSTERPYKVSGRQTGKRGPILTAEGAIQDDSGEIFALATGKLFQIR